MGSVQCGYGTADGQGEGKPQRHEDTKNDEAKGTAES